MKVLADASVLSEHEKVFIHDFKPRLVERSIDPDKQNISQGEFWTGRPQVMLPIFTRANFVTRRANRARNTLLPASLFKM
jgi:hypothetical protein